MKPLQLVDRLTPKRIARHLAFRAIAMLVLGGLLAGALAACAGGTSSPSSSGGASAPPGAAPSPAAPVTSAGAAASPAAATGANPGAGTTTSKTLAQFVVDLPADVASLDPGTQYDTSSYAVYGNVFDTLLARDPKTAEITPRLATQWDALNDTTWQLKLRSGVTFQNGEPFNAQCVKLSLERIIDPALRSPQASNFALIDHVDVVDDYTVKIVTKAPYPALPSYLVTHQAMPYTYTKETSADKLALQPIGTGPYKFVEWIKGDHVTLEANPAYWRGTPPIQKVIFKTVLENSTRVADLLSGNADFIFGVVPDDVDRIKANPQLQVFSGPTERIAYIAFESMPDTGTPTADVKVRQAIAYAIDREGLLKKLVGGYGKITNELLIPEHLGYMPDIKPFTYDPKEAKRLLAEAGKGSGIELTFLTSPAYAQGKVLGEAIQQLLGDVGITVTIQSVEWATYLKTIQTPGQWRDIRFGQWSCSCLDADGVLYPLSQSSSIWSSYRNAQLDNDLTAARATLKPDDRKANYAKANQIIRDEVPLLPLWQVYSLNAAKNTIDFTPTVDEQFYLFDIGVK